MWYISHWAELPIEIFSVARKLPAAEGIAQKGMFEDNIKIDVYECQDEAPHLYEGLKRIATQDNTT